MADKQPPDVLRCPVLMFLAQFFPFLTSQAEAASVALDSAIAGVDARAAGCEQELQELVTWRQSVDTRLHDVSAWVQRLDSEVKGDTSPEAPRIGAPRPAGFRWVAVIASQPPSPGEVTRASELQELQELQPGQVWVLVPDVAA